MKNNKFKIDTNAKVFDVVLGLNDGVKFHNYLTGGYNYDTVNIVYFDPSYEFGGRCRLITIIVEKNGKYQDFYWNNGFKMLSEPIVNNKGYTVDEWWEEEQTCHGCRVHPPEWFTETTDLGLNS